MLLLLLWNIFLIFEIKTNIKSINQKYKKHCYIGIGQHYLYWYRKMTIDIYLLS